MAEDDAVQLMVLELRGRCITPADLGARYRQVRNADFPQPDNPDPVSYRRVQIDGVRVSFGFRGAAPAACRTWSSIPRPTEAGTHGFQAARII
ncbi:hypothetical protein ACFQOZ_18100 [Comamonas endophytica]|uniref:hypothetical protein n=1 Tax=Comamonas endophytica TaxID=2949090 RepID=UPI003614C9A6